MLARKSRFKSNLITGRSPLEAKGSRKYAQNVRSVELLRGKDVVHIQIPGKKSERKRNPDAIISLDGYLSPLRRPRA